MTSHETELLETALVESYAIVTKLGRLEGICRVGLDLGRLLCAVGQQLEGLEVLERSRTGYLQLGRQDYAA